MIQRSAAGAVFALLPAIAAVAGVGENALADPFSEISCPESVAAIARCYSARDGNGAWLLAALPRQWNRGLVVHAHGGPRLGPPGKDDSHRDLERYGAMVAAGYAWVGSTYRRGGYGVRRAAADVENSRLAFVEAWGQPARTLLHGQSWGGNVAAKAAELYALDDNGGNNYDAVLVTNGVLTGGTGAYGFRADLRAVYQYFCGNHPAPDEPQYPLWQGLPAGSTMTRVDLRQRINACTGVDMPPGDRGAHQQARLDDILAVTGIAESQLVAHLAWGTFHFRDLVQRHLHGGNPFDNTAVIYQGSADDEALNSGVERFAADPSAVALLAYDADLSGQIVLPTLAVHARHDPVVSSRAPAAYGQTVAAAGRGDLFVYALTDESNHSRLLDGTYLTILAAVEDWLDGGKRPQPEAFQALCISLVPEPAGCRFP